MEMVARAPQEPADDLRDLVGPVVVHDEVDRAVGRELRIEPVQELQKLLMAMPPMALADDLPGGHVQRGNSDVVPCRM